MNSFWEAAPWVGAAGLGAGLGARALKHTLDMTRHGNIEGTPVDVEDTPPAITSLPITVTPEEAAELRRKGIHVKKKQKKVAFDIPGTDSKYNVGFWESIPAGMLGTGALIGGWKLGDMGLNAIRGHFANAKKKKVEDRIKQLLKDQPESEDVPLHATMKAAEDAYFAKKAMDYNRNFGGDYANALGLLLGAGGTLSALSAYNTVSSQNKYKEKAKALRAYLRNKAARPAIATMEPIEEAAPAVQSAPA
jgi:hypothetical protein